MLARSPGEGRYAQLEHEQRWLLSRLPDQLKDPVEIRDHYLTHTQLRLRRMQSSSTVVWKLAQKVRVVEASPERVKLTNIYLNELDYQRLSQMESEVLVKTRWCWNVNERALSVDAFGGHLEGLVLAEVELGSEEGHISAPPFAVLDVTLDDRYSGGALAALDSQGAAELRRSVLTHP
jgi:CYTH domain-containing protein